MEEGKRYQRVNGVYVGNPKGRWLAKKGPMGAIGALDLTVATQFGYPKNPGTGVDFVLEGIIEDVVGEPTDEPKAAMAITCPHCGGTF